MRTTFLAFLICLALAVGIVCPLVNQSLAAPASAPAPDANDRALPEKKSVSRYYNRASHSISRGMYDEALQEIETGLKLDPGYAPFLVQKALVLAKLGQYEESMALTTLALGAMPDSRELQIQAVKNLLDLNKDNKARSIKDLTEYFEMLGPDRLPGAAVALTEDFGRHDSRFTLILQAVAASQSLPAREQSIVTALLAGKAQHAAEILRKAIDTAKSDLATDKTQFHLMGALSVLVAEQLEQQGKTGEAEALYAQSAVLGYSEEKMLESKGDTYLGVHAYAKAAQVYSENWRSATDPVLWAVNAANSFSATGHKDEAWKILQQARTAYSEDVWLLGQLYLRTALAGNNAELHNFATELEHIGLPVALEYGKFLVARHNEDIPEMNAARDRVVQKASGMTFVHEQEDVRRVMKDLGFTGDESPMARQAVRLRGQGWDLWNQGQYEDAYRFWLDSVSLMPDQVSKAATFSMATQLLYQNMPDKALTLLHKQFPHLSDMEFALPFIFHEQWSALEPLLKNMSPPTATSLTPWYTLALAHSALKNGITDGLEAKVKNLLATTPPQGAQTVTVPDNHEGTTELVIDPPNYAALLKAFFTELFHQDYTQYFLEVQASNSFAMLPADDQAALLSRAALHMITGGNVPQAAPLLEATLKIAPRWADAHLGMALVETSRGNDAAAQAHLLQGQASSSAQKNYVLGRIDMLNNNNRAAEKHFENYLREEPNNLGAAFELFNLYMSMPNYRKARAVMQRFKKRGDSESLLYLAQCEAALGNWREGERILKGLLAHAPGHAPAILALVATLRAQERFDEATSLLTTNGLEDPEVLTALRIRAEKALLAGNMAEAREHIEKFLKKSPSNVYLNSLYNISLRDEYRQQNDALEILRHDYAILHKGQTNVRLLDVDHLRAVQNTDERTLTSMQADDTLLDLASNHAKNLLQRNTIQRNALESLLDIALQRKDFREAARISRFMAAAHPYDTHYQLQAAIHIGSTGRFDLALPVVENLTNNGPNAAGMALHFVDVSSGPGHRSYTPADIENYLDVLGPSHNLVSLTHFLSAPQEKTSASKQADKIPLLLVVGQATPQEITSLDAALQKRGGKAVLLVDEQSFTAGVPAHLPDVPLLRALIDSGRWELALTDNMNRTITKDQHGTVGNFWAEGGMRNGRPETEEEMRTRWFNTLARIKESARTAGFDIHAWMYPGGDFGQLSLDGTPGIRQAYTSAVNELFDVGMVPSSEGYHTDSVDSHFLPVRSVYGNLDTLTLAAMPQMHPNRLAVQTEAVLSSWHGQLPRAERLFERASHLGLAPRDIAYYRAANAIYDGDAPYANQLARTVLATDPESIRAEKLQEQAQNMLRPRVSFTPRWWKDNADRSYAEYKVNFSTHVRENMMASFHVSDITWRDDNNTQHGRGVGVGLRYYPFKQHWIDLTVGGVLRDSSNNTGFGQWGASWRGAYATDALNLNGAYTVSYNRESIETGESIEDGIYADRLAFSSQARFLNWGILETEIYGISRTDGNNTKGITLSPLYILWDKPNIRVGYLFGMANSDHNPPEYYAPQEYINHMAIASAQYKIFDGFSLQGMLGYGTARTKGKDWEQVVRYNTQLNWRASDDWNFSAGYQRLELPTYTMDQFSLGVQYVF